MRPNEAFDIEHEVDRGNRKAFNVSNPGTLDVPNMDSLQPEEATHRDHIRRIGADNRKCPASPLRQLRA